MNLSAAEQILIVEKLAEICASVPECGVIVPAPIVFEDKADFQKSVGDHALDTQKKIETSEVAFAVITFSKLPRKPAQHGGWWSYYYNIYLFREYDAERLDESIAADEFKKRLLKSYTDFTSAILGLHTAIGEELQLDINSPNFIGCILRQQSGADEFIEDYDKCRFIPGVLGYSIDFPLEVKVRFGEC